MSRTVAEVLNDIESIDTAITETVNVIEREQDPDLATKVRQRAGVELHARLKAILDDEIVDWPTDNRQQVKIAARPVVKRLLNVVFEVQP